MNKKSYTICLLIPILVFGLMIGIRQGMSQGQQQPPMPPPVTQLNNALQAAGASALSSAQEESILALIKAFRDAHQPQPNAAVQSARAAYESAILNGDSATAASQAQIIAGAQTADILQRETAAAVFAINVLSILKTDSAQFSALKTTLGERGLVRLVLDLEGRPGGGPGQGRGRGPGGSPGGGPRGRGPGGRGGNGAPSAPPLM